MAAINTWFTQDINKPVKVQHIDGSLFSNNANGNVVGVELFESGEPYTISGTVSGYVVTSDGTTVPCTGSKSANRASITIPPAAYQPGNVFVTIFLTDGQQITTICAVSTGVLTTRTNNQVAPGSVVTDWTNTINAALQDVETAAENVGQIVATPYASLTYPVPLGKYTTYNGNLYRCTMPISASESFTAAHWSAEINLGDEVSALKNEIDDVQSEYLVFEKNENLTVVNIENTMPGNIAVTATPHNENRFQPNPYGEPTSVTKNGVTFTRDENGVLTIDGTPSAFTRYYYIAASSAQKFPNENGKVWISMVSTQPVSIEYYYDTSSSTKPNVSRRTYGALEIDTHPYADYNYVVVDLYLITGAHYDNCKVYVAFETGETMHNDVICVSNKNLFRFTNPIRLDNTYQLETSGTYNGISWSVDYDENSVTLNGTASASFYVTFFTYYEKLVPIAPGSLCMLSGSETSNDKCWCYVTFKDNENTTLFQVKDTYKSNTLVSSDYYSVSGGIRVVSGAVLNNVVYRPMLEIGKQRTRFVKQEVQMYSPFFGETNTLRSYDNSTALYSRTGALSFSATVPISYPQYSQSIFGSDVREITVCTYNVGVWNYGDRSNPLYHGNDMPGVISLLKQFLADGNIDVLAMQEYRDFFDPEKTYRTITELFEPVFSEYFRGNTSEIVFSRYLFQNRFKGYVGDSVNRGYMIHDITVGSTTVRIINTHLIYNDATERTVEMQHIVDRALTNYTVILGDFNVHDSSEYAPFVNAGLIPANGGYFGDFITTKTSGGKYDNIWVTPNIQIVNVWQADLHDSPGELDIPSDHLPLLAKLIIHGSTNNTDSEDYEEN